MSISQEIKDILLIHLLTLKLSGGSIVSMDRYSVNEIAENLGIHPKAAKTRLRRVGVQPVAYVGPTALYSLDAIEAIREVRSRGRPKKDK